MSKIFLMVLLMGLSYSSLAQAVTPSGSFPGLPFEVKKSVKLEKAWHIYSENASANPTQALPKSALHDVSFFGHKILLGPYLDLLGLDEVAPLTLISPHGASVGQVFLAAQGASHFQGPSLLTKGIYVEDFKESLKRWKEHDIKLVNLSMSIRDHEIVALLNEFIDAGGIVIASSGNSGVRQGVSLARHYSDFKGITIGATSVSGVLEPFSQYSEKTIFAPGSRELYPVKRLTYTIAPKEEPIATNEKVRVTDYNFGMTSAAAPLVSGVVALALGLDPELKQAEINKLLSSSTEKGLKVFNAERFLRFVLINKLFKEFYEKNYRPLMCSDNIYDFIQELVKAELLKEGEASVLHIRKRMAPFAAIFPQRARAGQKSWSFHAFLNLRGLILDFDYEDSPELEWLGDYKKKMWHENEALLYQEKDALEYSMHDVRGQMNQEQYPLLYW